LAHLTSHIATIIRGSVGGITYAANRSHAITARARIYPCNPKTTPQGNSKQWFLAAVQLWQVAGFLTHQSWNNLAKDAFVPCPTGLRKLSGRELFIGAVSYAYDMFNRGYVDNDPSDLAPQDFGGYPLAVLGPIAPLHPGTGFSFTGKNVSARFTAFITSNSPAFSPARYCYSDRIDQESYNSTRAVAGAAFAIDTLDLIEDATYFARIRAITVTAPYWISKAQIFRCTAIVKA